MSSTLTFTSFEYEDVLKTLIDQGDPTGDEIYEGMCRLGRNHGPALLNDLMIADALGEDAAERLVGAAWSAAEYPQDYLDNNVWMMLFTLAGYTVDGIRKPLPTEPMVLYRGAPEEYKSRWSWTDSREYGGPRWSRGVCFAPSTRDAGRRSSCSTRPAYVLLRSAAVARGCDWETGISVTTHKINPN